ncbi:signal peptidase II [Corynebacterium tapiri]|uniref:Lipoprotein signal peptidase n=1 Tax=Corynebacterium tapiri TaxID=1448266 RepID=A0A5C4U5X4_9CORY|nr:signal peptidase II [Corynebacterium tapiri]TNL99463.1 signal peptidase II [Corynebacterium tapiri]
MLGIMLAVAAIDQATKQYMLSTLVEGVARPVIGDWFRFLLIFNPGAAFGLGQNNTWLFTTIQLGFVIAACIASWFMRDRFSGVGLAFIGGGALGNLIDRLFREPGFWFGHVVDFISVGNFAIFNLADAAINVGVVLFIIAIVTEERRHGA